MPTVQSNPTRNTFTYNAFVNHDVTWWPQPCTVGDSQVCWGIHGEVKPAQFSGTVNHYGPFKNAPVNLAIVEHFNAK